MLKIAEGSLPISVRRLNAFAVKAPWIFRSYQTIRSFRTWVENTRTSVYVTDLQLIKITFSQVPFAWVFQMFF